MRGIEAPHANHAQIQPKWGYLMDRAACPGNILEEASACHVIDIQETQNCTNLTAALVHILIGVAQAGSFRV
jgi:hypothetical protein